ncbi:N5-glutamine methyltransferase family protein [Adlercreutzia caecimuris]|jgi:release factor glutamine methyltransferase|uniref:Release factor glutamine methyltransferase n=1 Tax=Adlercreutzia caecimuris B7 TaxID=1235794 RepID=R9L1H0_9ACTN|nr:HemK/PrmC family methyltransferase [Adlercreutzia caecimuris]EOS52664.1 HemK family methyltransferase [Adlercreutzia caecimuris B7]MCI9208762.1 peptide chain release factor N(5)-glutamine methyltransferase [Adlercreutzia caecimuris]
MSEWTVKSALDWTTEYLTGKGDENPLLSAQWLIGEACGLTRVQLYMNYDRPLSEDERSTLRDYVRRRGAGEPLQYITGEVAFRHITVKVRPGVLIPRPETEVLVSEALAMLPAPAKHEAQWNPEAAERESAAVEAVKKALDEAGVEPIGSEETPVSEDAARPLLVADLCTGSGCIACSLAYEHPDVRVIATDIAPEAVALARENAEALELADRVAVLECSLGTGIGEKRMGTFDAVVSNPPYVPTSVLADIPREVADYEPALALDGGADGLDVFRPLAAWAARALRPGGVLACELHEGHLDAARTVAEAAGFAEVRIVDDLAGRPRVLVGLKAGGHGVADNVPAPSEAR